MSFLFPSFLYALGAVSIPVIIHLIQLRRAKRIYFTNLSFIKEVKNVTASHNKLKHILILISRSLFLVFLVLLFAQPFIPNKNYNGLKSKNIKFFIDNSYSMQSEGINNNISLLQEAVDYGKRVVGFLNVNSIYQLATNSRFSYNNQSGSEIINQMELIKESAFSRSFNTISSWFNQSDNNSPFTAFLFSDFQKNTFNVSDFNRLDSTNQYYLIPIKSTQEENLYIDTVYNEDAFIRVNENNTLLVKIRNAGNKDVKDCQVSFFIGNKQVSTTSITVPAKKTIPFTLTYRLNKDEASSDGRIVIEDYPVTFDNTYYFTLKPSPNIKILELSDSQPVGDKLFTNENVFQYISSISNNINYKQVEQADIIILNSLRSIDVSLADNLSSFVKTGGNLLIIPTADLDADSYQALFRKISLKNIGFFEKRDTIKSALANPDLRNPFFKNIYNEESRRTIMPNATKFLNWNRSSNDILKFKTGGSFLSSFKVEEGNAFLFSSPLINTYSDFQNHALFVPVMYKLAMLSSRQQQPLAYSLSSPIISLPFKQALKPEQIIKLNKDTIEYIPEQQIRKNQLVLGIPSDLNEGGFYNITQNDKPITRLAFNFDKRESNITQYTPDEIRALIKGRDNIRVLDPAKELEIKKELNNGELGTPLWKYCLILCLIFMLTEVLLIRYL